MKSEGLQLIDLFTPLFVYVLEFQENSMKPIYTIKKLETDIDRLLEESKNSFDVLQMRTQWEDALFGVAAWIDEVILNSEFSERRAWQKHLLQKRFFHTTNAGEEFYQRQENLPKSAAALHLLYLYLLYLGFRGQYFPKSQEKDLLKVIQKQKSYVQQHFPRHFPHKLFKEAYAQNQLPQKQRFASSYQNLWIIFIVSLVAGALLFVFFYSNLDTLLSELNLS